MLQSVKPKNDSNFQVYTQLCDQPIKELKRTVNLIEKLKFKKIKSNKKLFKKQQPNKKSTEKNEMKYETKRVQ